MTTMINQKLYKRDSKGKVRVWWVEVDDAEIISHHGVDGGKIVSKSTTAKPKNIGRSNETSAEQQALLEAQSKWLKQVQRDDYNVDVEKAGLQTRPSLALDYKNASHRVNWSDVIAQPKLDGLRLLVGNRTKTGGWDRTDYHQLSRKGDLYDIAHLQDSTRILLSLVNEKCGNRCLALDGEAYIHGIELQTINSYAKSYKEGKTEQLEFHLFDLVITEYTFTERYTLLVECFEELAAEHPALFSNLKLVPCVPVVLDTLEQLHGSFVEQGYEGIMLRHKSSKYEMRRGTGIFKKKHFYDQEFKIIDVWEDNNGNAMFTCEMTVGQVLVCDDSPVESYSTFDCTPKATHARRKEMLNERDQLIGKYLKVKYQSLTSDRIPTFGVGLGVRECDENGKPVS